MIKSTVNCGYKHCQHESRELPRDNAIRKGNMYYHKECMVIKDNINEMKILYCENIDKEVSVLQLYGVINNIIFTKKIDSSFLLFGLKYWIRKKVKVNNPYLLHYIPKNQRLIREWDYEKSKQIGGDEYLF